jgi:septal ring factor EnvC (AmiA/AmiB activator)
MIGVTDSLLRSMNDKLDMLHDTRAEISHYREEIDLEKNLLRSERKRRNSLMDRIRSEENLHREHLRQLELDVRAADSLFVVDDEGTGTSLFETQKGRLPPPLDGRIVKGFGKVRDRETRTEIHSSGIEIEGSAGSEIRAVYDGAVFHRGSLRGYGKVLILDHGDGWYTLYAHLAGYNVDLRQRVTTGDVIGHLEGGKAGEKTLLHFEIRHRREQHDPVEWLKL